MRLCNCKICLVCTCIPYVHTVYFFCTICTQGVRVLTGGQAASHSSSLFLFSYTRLLSRFIAFLKTNFNLLICNVKFHIFFFKFLTLLSNNESVNSSVQGGCREKSHICTRWCEQRHPVRNSLFFFFTIKDKIKIIHMLWNRKGNENSNTNS